MKNSSRKSISIYLFLHILLFALMLTGCGKQSASEGTASAAPAVQAYVPDTGYAEYSCKNEIATEELIYVQLDINPSFILGMTKDYKVVSIVANNEDAEDVMLNCMEDYFADVTDGIELENVIRDLAEATKQGGYIEDTFDVSVTVLSGEVEESVFEEAFDSAKTELAEKDGIEATIEDYTVDIQSYTENQSSADSFVNQDNYNDQGSGNDSGSRDNQDNQDDENNSGSPDNDNNNPYNPNDEMSDEEDKTCDLCHGECTIVCDLCNGEGTIIETEEREVQVRNNYVCPYCGGVGILDDGMHGGQKAVCGHCGGEGKTGPMSGDFRELAYDTEIVEEEVERTCPRCNGSGILDCPHCNGIGFIE